MIKSFKHKGLKKYYLTGSTAGIQSKHKTRLSFILAAIDAATMIEDLNLSSFRLHKLTGNRKDVWSITVQANWRVTFGFNDSYAELLNYEDYH